MNTKDHHELSELLSAYLDDELSAEDKARVEQRLQDDVPARRLLEELRTTVALVSSLPRRAAPGSVAQDIELRLERHELLGDVPDSLVSPRKRWPIVRATLSLAAVLGVVVFAGLYIANDRSPEESARTNKGRWATRSQAGPDGVASDKVDKQRVARRSARRRRSERDHTDRKTSLSETERVATRAGRESKRIRNVESSSQSADSDATSRPPKRSGLTQADVSKSSATKSDAVSAAARTAGREPSTLLPPRDAMILSITVPSEEDRTALIRSLSARFADATVERTSSARFKSEARKSASSSDRGIRSRRTRRKRKITATPAPLTSREVTLNIPLRSLATIVTDIDSRIEHADMSVQAGPLHVSGRDRVARLIDVLTATATPPHDERAGRTGDNSAGAFAKPWRDLLAALGLDADVFLPRADANTTSGALDEPSRSAAKRTTTVSEQEGRPTKPSGKVSNVAAAQSSPPSGVSDRSEAVQESKDKVADAGDAVTKHSARSPLVARRMKALERERRKDEPANTAGKQPKDAERPQEVGGGSHDTTRSTTHDEPFTSGDRATPITSSTEQRIALIVRIDVDPSMDAARTIATPTPKNIAPDAKRTRVVKPSETKKSPGKNERTQPAPTKKKGDRDNTHSRSFQRHASYCVAY